MSARDAICIISNTKETSIGEYRPVNPAGSVILIIFVLSIDATSESGRYGRLINHSRITPNIVPKIVVVDKVPRLILVAKHSIIPGVELLYDYGDRSKESLKAHPWLAL